MEDEERVEGGGVRWWEKGGECKRWDEGTSGSEWQEMIELKGVEG